MTDVLLVILAAAFALAGSAKVLGLGPTKANFERWAVPAWSRPVVGVVELVTAACAVGGLTGNESATQVAALLALWVMVGAVAIHAMAGDPPKEVAPAIVLLVIAVALLSTTV
ncbi:MAG: DoxX family protein [Solirubrobacteraceae bacterium]|nr:DoxX family protein [Solirubrobacteraceae bacterium]